MRVFPNCREETTSIITELSTKKRFCHNCSPDKDDPTTTVAAKLHYHATLGNLVDYHMADRLKDLGCISEDEAERRKR